MSVFGNYARYYDVLYRDKDYDGETAFVHGLIQRYAPNAHTILEFGCGTGKHAERFANRGYTVHGVDRSAVMLQQAQARRAELPADLAARLSFSEGDFCHVRLDRQADVALALFHVLSYQPTNADLRDAFVTAQTHLKPGGIFLCDYWYGPAVLTDPPAVRVKRLEDDRIHVTRIAEPRLYPNENLVDVTYTMFMRDKQTGATEELTETHRMRYLFQPEIEWLCEHSHLTLRTSREWLTDREPGLTTWGVYALAQNGNSR